ncbi:hypothetical protein TNCT_679071 [Trichonephila clavata]|uniref:Uncharacterized protein n=1 Tax=Trichonephila clavata TaxID=2740835 RepID=A0A8X6FFQ2_TRICU|nr:hypothetical protein TNCT_679071 [Trichonephila clavata]
MKKSDKSKNKSKNPISMDGFTSPTKHCKRQKILENYSSKKNDLIYLGNKLDVLATSSNEPPTPDQQTTPVAVTKIPPVMLKFQENFNTLILEITKRYTESTFKLAGEYLKIYSPIADDYRVITYCLTEIGE